MASVERHRQHPPGVHFDRHDQCDKIKVLDISQLLAEAIKRIHLEQSISSLFIQ